MIEFCSVSYKNFLSSGNSAITIKLNTHQMTLIAGSNGAGKTTIIEALCFGLFNKPYRNITKPQLVNSINQKQCLVTVEFKTNGNHYVVSRGIKPAVFEITENGKLINQDPDGKDYQQILEQQILKMNFRAFTQVVVMGSGDYIQFMKLKPQPRRDFIEDLLDIRIFSVMAGVVKEDIKKSRDNKLLLASEVKRVEDNIAIHERMLARQNEDVNSQVSALEDKISSLVLANKKLQDNAEQLNGLSAKLKDKMVSYDSSAEITELTANIRFNSTKLKELIEKKRFYENVDICPTCTQTIEDRHREGVVVASETTIQELREEITNAESSLLLERERLTKYKEFGAKLSEVNDKLVEINRRVYSNQSLIDAHRREITSLKDRAKSVIDVGDIDKARIELVSLVKKSEKISEELEYDSVISGMLTDSGIKSKVIKQYIPAINQYVNEYLDKLDFFVKFEIDEEFNEIVKSRHRDVFTYDSFSEGQKMRIDVSLLFAWRKIASSKNSVNTNLLFFDELLDGSLDGDVLESVVSLLRSQQGSNVFVISHRPELADKFDKTIKIGMKNNFSYIAD